MFGPMRAQLHPELAIGFGSMRAQTEEFAMSFWHLLLVHWCPQSRRAGRRRRLREGGGEGEEEEEGEGEEEEEEEEEEGVAPLLKSRDPHMAAGEKKGSKCQSVLQ